MTESRDRDELEFAAAAAAAAAGIIIEWAGGLELAMGTKDQDQEKT